MVKQALVVLVIIISAAIIGCRDEEKNKEGTVPLLTPVPILAPTDVSARIIATDDIQDRSILERANDAYAPYVILLAWKNPPRESLDDRRLALQRTEGTSDPRVVANRFWNEESFYDVWVKPSTTYTYFIEVIDDRDVKAQSITVTVTTPSSPHPAPPPDSPPQWLSVASPTTDDLSSVWGSSADNVYILGYSWKRYQRGRPASVLYNFNGVWFNQEYAPRTDPLRILWGFSADDLWAAGNSIIVHWRSIGGRSILSPPELTMKNIYGLWGASPNDIWAVGTNGTPGMSSLHYDGKKWMWEYPGAELFDLWGFSSTDVWAIGGNWLGTYILHYDGQQWTHVWGGSAQEWGTCIWGAAPNDLWVVGGSGFILHYDGNSWQRVPSPTNKNLLALWGFSATDVWTAGENGALLHYDGFTWTSHVSPTTETILDLWGTSSRDVWAVGNKGTILRYR